MNFRYSDIYLAIATEDIEALYSFYSKLLKRDADVYRPAVYAEFQLERLRIAIFQPKPQRQSEFANTGSGLSLCLDVEDLDKAIALLADLGYPPPGEVINASHGQEIYAYDPAGNRLILHQPKR